MCIFSDEDGLWALADFSAFPQGAKIAREQGTSQLGNEHPRVFAVVALALYRSGWSCLNKRKVSGNMFAM